MIQPEFQLVYNATSGTTVVVASGNVLVHTLVSPIASTGTILLKDATFATVASFPIGTIGTMILDAKFGNGLTMVKSASDSAGVTYQTP